MNVGPLSPGTRRRLLEGQAGPLPALPPSSVAIFISSTVSGKGQGRAWVLEASEYSWEMPGQWTWLTGSSKRPGCECSPASDPHGNR